jgi:hypothetical protein
VFNINFGQLISDLTPDRYRGKTVLFEWHTLLYSQIKSLHTIFINYREELLYKTRFNSQVIYLEKRLNDRFDNINRGIYIDNVADKKMDYLYNKSENRSPVFHYNNYNNSTAYSVNDYAQTAVGIYKCISNSTGNTPDISPTFWTLVHSNIYYKNTSEYWTQIDFIVMVPISVVFNQDEMKSIVNYYKLAGKRYTIQTY